MGGFLDTSFLIALHDVGDVNHVAACLLRERIQKNEFGKVYLSDYIFDEFVTFLLARSFPNSFIKAVGDALLADQSITLLRVDSVIFNSAWQFFKQFRSLSFTDCTTITLCKQNNFYAIFSFDSDFDKLEKIKRVY